MGVSSGLLFGGRGWLESVIASGAKQSILRPAGRVERSDTHQYCACGDGFRFALPILRGEAIQLVACSPDERSDIRGGVRVVPGCRCAHPGYDLNTTSHSRDALRPRFLHLLSALFKTEGAGKTGCLLHPRSRVRFAQTKVHTSIQGSGSIPAFPAQWLYGLLRALPGERLSCHRRLREASLLSDLAPAPRRP